MAAPYFRLSDTIQPIPDGLGTLNSGVTTVYNGYLMKYDVNDGTLKISTGSPECIMWDNLALEVFPTSDNIATYRQGKLVTTISGNFRATAGSGMFANNVLPVGGQNVYDNGNGIYTTTAATGKQLIAKCTGTTTQLAVAQGITGLVVLEFSLNRANNTAN